MSVITCLRVCKVSLFFLSMKHSSCVAVLKLRFFGATNLQSHRGNRSTVVWIFSWNFAEVLYLRMQLLLTRESKN